MVQRQHDRQQLGGVPGVPEWIPRDRPENTVMRPVGRVGLLPLGLHNAVVLLRWRGCLPLALPEERQSVEVSARPVARG